MSDHVADGSDVKPCVAIENIEGFLKSMTVYLMTSSVLFAISKCSIDKHGEIVSCRLQAFYQAEH